MEEIRETKIYLTNLFLYCGDIMPFVIVEKHHSSNHLDLNIRTYIFSSSKDILLEKKLISHGRRRDFWGERVLSELDTDDVFEIMKFYVKKELADFVREKTNISIEDDFELEECSLAKLFLLTGAEVENNKRGEYFEHFNDFNEIYNKFRTIFRPNPNSFDMSSNIWTIEEELKN